MKHVLFSFFLLISISGFAQEKKDTALIRKGIAKPAQPAPKYALTLDAAGFAQLFDRLSTSGQYTGSDIKDYEAFLKKFIKAVPDSAIKK